MMPKLFLIKGGYYVLKLAEMMKNENIKFIIAGSYLQDLKVPDNVILLGRINDQEQLAKLYSMADVTLLTSKKETFSMIVAESLCCGTPVVGFKAGAPEMISLTEYSTFVEYSRTEDLKNAVIQYLSKSFDKEEIAQKAEWTYSKGVMAQNYFKLYTK